MANVCDCCGKGSLTGNTVSKSKHRIRRTWKPNLMKVKTDIDGVVRTYKICSRCLRTSVKNPDLFVKKV